MNDTKTIAMFMLGALYASSWGGFVVGMKHAPLQDELVLLLVVIAGVTAVFGGIALGFWLFNAVKRHWKD